MQQVVPREVLCSLALSPVLLPLVGRSKDLVLYADAPEYCLKPTRQRTRETAKRAIASATATARVSPDSRPVRASAGTVVANATGTIKVSAKRSHPGYRLMG